MDPFLTLEKMKTLELNETAGGISRPVTSTGERHNIADFGEKIHGARKDTWKQYADTMAAGLPSDFAQITLAKHFPAPDYAAAIERGACPENLAMIAALRDMIPAKPRNSWKLERWGKLVLMVHGIAQRMAADEFKLSPERMDELLKDAGEEIQRKVKLYRRLGFPLFTRADGWEISAGEWGIRDGDGLKWSRYSYAKKAGHCISETKIQTADDKAGWEGVFNMVKNKIAEEMQLPAEAKEIKFNLYSERRTGEIFIGKKGLRDVIRLKTGFKTAKDAREWLAANHGELVQQWETLRKAPQLRKAANLPRIGNAWRADGGNVSPETFSAKFGFRGVQFGNYVEGDRRQSDLNESHDAFLDLAAALGMAPRAVSLAGGLGMAFGARGRGGDAIAHFEAGQVVINITKTRGPGSLAHEWFHAFDNFAARVNETGRTDTRADAYQSASMKPAAHLPADVVAAFATLRRVIGSGTFAERSDKLDCARAKAYYGTTIEKAARAFEIYVADRLAETGVFNDYLVNVDKQTGGEAYPTADEMAGGIAAAFDAIFTAMKNSPFFNI